MLTHPHCHVPQASAFVLFPDIMAACEAANVLRVETSVDAVEMFDRASLRECSSNESMTKLVPDIIGENTPLPRTYTTFPATSIRLRSFLSVSTCDEMPSIR